MTRPLILAALVAFASLACDDDDSNTDPIVQPDVAADAGPADDASPADASPQDATVDANADAQLDMAPQDAALDAAPDATLDATPDAQLDMTAPDAAPDASPDAALVCGPNSTCADDEDCVGGSCAAIPVDGACTCVADAPNIPLNPCGPFGGCCVDADCDVGAVCMALGYNRQGAYCGGAAPPQENMCLPAGCDACTPEEVCVPAGAFGYVADSCVRASCLSDADCDARPGGACRGFFTRCATAGFACTYGDDPCRADADCPPGAFPVVCLPNAARDGTTCVEQPPRP